MLALMLLSLCSLLEVFYCCCDPVFLPNGALKFHLIMKYFQSYHFFFSLFICHAVCFDKMNIPTDLTPIWQRWHEADGFSSYVERCYRRLTVKICYLNRVACWRRVACRLLRVSSRESHAATASDIKLRTSNCLIQKEWIWDVTSSYPQEVYVILNIVNLNGGDAKLELFWEHFSSIQFQVPHPWCACCWKSDALVRAEGIAPPLIHSLPRQLLARLPEILCLSRSLFLMLWSDIPQCCVPN